MYRLLIAAGCLLVSCTLAHSAAAQDLTAKTEPLIQRARDQGLAYLNSKDEKAKKSAKQDLEDAEQILKEGVKKEPTREKYWELIVATRFYKAYFGFSKNYDQCVEAADEGLEHFPTNARLSYFKGYAHFNEKDYPEALKAFNRYLAAPAADSASQAQVRQLVGQSQQQFLGQWNRQADFYNSKESRIERVDPQTYKPVPVFQATRDWELQLGSQGFAALTANAPKLEDPDLQAYLGTLVNRLVSSNPGAPFDFQLTVLNSPLVNAVTPPGHVIVYSGLLGFVDNESELAAVLAHELGHNYAHHQARAAIKAMLAQGAANGLAQMLNPKGMAEKLAVSMGTSLGMMLYMRAYSRYEEKEADLYASHIMFNAGFNPTSESAFFLKMYQTNPKQPIKFLSTHPPVPDRATYLTDYLESFPLEREMTLDSQAFQKIRTRYATVAAGRGALPR